MFEVKLTLDENGKGAFKLLEDQSEIGEMVIGILGASMRVYHTEIDPKYEGKGLSKKLLEAMAEYVRQNHLKVTPLCQYVLVQFQRHPETFADIWNRA